MAEQSHFVCIGCPIGCPLQLTHEGKEIIEVSGQECNRGAKYAAQEFTDPRRVLTTTVAVEGGRWERLPVKVSAPLLKTQLFAALAVIHEVVVTAPVEQGQVLVRDILGEAGLHVVATRSMPQQGK